MLMTGVYGIRNKVNGKIYVGSAAKSIARRWRGHLSLLKNGRHHSIHLQNAWNKYGENKFEFVVLQRCTSMKCVVAEQKFIDKFNSANCKFGYNRHPTARSPLGFKHSPEALSRRKGKPLSLEVRTKMALARIGRKLTKEHKRNIGISRTGFRHTEETKKKQSLAKRGRKLSEEHRKKLSLAHAGKPRPTRRGIRLSEVHRKKLSEGQLRRFQRPSELEKIRLVNLGRKHTAETRKKMSLAKSGRPLSREHIKSLREAGKQRRELRKIELDKLFSDTEST